MTRLLVRFAILLLLLGQIATAQSLVTITETGARNARLNLVMLSEGYTAAELSANKFKNDATTISNALLNTEPFKSYRPFFNVYGIAVASVQSGADQGSAGGSRNTYFNAFFYDPPLERLLVIDSTGYSRATSLLNTFVPERDIVLVIVNDSKYGGSGGTYAVTSTNASAAEIAIHEIGHTFAGLGDEYDYPGANPSEDPNTTQETRRAFIRWNHWINASTPIITPETSTYGNGLVGLFEGAAYNETGWYRPTLDSKMKTLGAPFYAVNEEAIVLSIYNRVSPITGSTPSSTVTVNQPNQTLTFNVDGPNTASTAPAIKVEWKLNGVVIPGQTGRTLTQNSSIIGNGSHTLVANVSDPTTKVRKDTSELLKDSRTWTLNLSHQGPAAPTNLVAVAKLNGSIDLTWTDTVTDEAGFVIERALGTSTVFAEVGRVATDASSFSDTTTTAGLSTKYRVRGINSANAAVLGDASNVVTITPLIEAFIAAGPSSLTLLQGLKATFTVSATGTALKYQWRFNTQPINGAVASSYVIAAVQPANAGSYDCVVSNSHGPKTSVAAVLTVETKPAITLHPVGQSLFSDQPSSLAVQATGSGPLSFQWRKGGVDISGAQSDHLTFSNLSVVDAGSYDCRVTNIHGNVISKPAILTVLGKPVITAQPVSLTQPRGVLAKFTVKALGTAPLAYQWRKAGVPIVGATASLYSLVATKDSDAAAYDCVVTNAYGVATSFSVALSFTDSTTSDYRLAGNRAGTAKWRWVKRFGGASQDTATAISTDVSGNVLFGGLSGGTGPSTLKLSPSTFGVRSGAYVGWLNPAGSTLALEALNASVPGRGTVCINPASGMQYVAAAQIGDADPGLVAFYQFGGIPSGTSITTFSYGDFPYPTFMPEAVVQGNVCFFVGGYETTAHDPMLRRLDVNLSGQPLNWTRKVTSAGASDAVLAVARLTSGNVIVAGTAEYPPSGQLAFENATTSSNPLVGTTPLPDVVLNGTAGLQTGFLACYNDSGEVLWAKAFASVLRSLAVDGSGALWCAGTEAGTVGVALKINASTGISEARFPVTGAEGLSIAPTTGGDVAFLTRLPSTSVSVQNFTNTRTGYAVMKFSSAGALRWVLPAFGAFGDYFTSTRARLAASADGQLYVALSMEGEGNVEFAGLAPMVMKGRKSDAFVAAVSELPQIETPPASQIVALGQALNLNVVAGGLSGAVSYQWLKDGRLIAGKTTSSLAIDVTKVTDAGSYSCRVTGNGGMVESAKAIVNIVDTTLRTLKAPMNKLLDLPVTAAGTGLSYTWWKGGVRLFNVGGYNYSTTNRLRINAMSPAFTDAYVCRVSGPGGTLDVPFNADVMYVPVFSVPTVPASIVSGTFTLQLSATDAASYAVTNLPLGLVYDAKTGRITGKPTTPGAKVVSVKATNAAGTTNPALTFTILVEDIAAYAKGNFQALIGRQPWNANLGGFITWALSASGVPTGTVKYAGAVYSITGRVEAVPASHEWTFSQRIARTGKPALLLNLVSPSATDGELTGTVALEAPAPEPALVSGRQTVWSSGRLPTAFAGTFNATMALPALLVGDPGVPQGVNTMKTVVNGTTGLATWSGKLGDNTAFSGSCYLWPSGAAPTWVALYLNYGSLLGSPLIASPNQNGILEWTRNPKTGAPSWIAFPLTVTGTKAP
ncbi:MAG: immunoglobulin domain-containing protein [Verrucomicrobiaceae bacterium]|nr:immunoglobulin domain-containing protein [Verrucomicrobiaceae bacterium]